MARDRDVRRGDAKLQRADHAILIEHRLVFRAVVRDGRERIGQERLPQPLRVLRDDDNREILGVQMPFDGGVQPVFEIDERAVRPEPVAQLIARQELARMLEHQREQREGLILEAKPHAVLAQLACAGVDLEAPEPEIRHA